MLKIVVVIIVLEAGRALGLALGLTLLSIADIFEYILIDDSAGIALDGNRDSEI